MNEGKVTVADIGPRLKLIRQELGITQKELAMALGMNQAILSKFENGGMVYASVLLDVFCFYRGKVNLNYLLQPGEGYDINDERARYSNNWQHDIIMNGRRRIALERMDKIIDDMRKQCEETVNTLADSYLSEKTVSQTAADTKTTPE